MDNLISKTYWFKRLPAIGKNASEWASHCAAHWKLSSYQSEHVIPSSEVRLIMNQYMPELVPDYDAFLAALPQRPDMAQLVAGYNLRPFFSGCSNSVSTRLGYPTLIRNYDFPIHELAGVFRHEPLSDGGWIIGSAESGWGYLDGMNHHGLAVAITFGGKYTVSSGFSIPIIVRYLLATSRTVPEAVERLRRIPHRLAQNLLLLDREGRYSVVYTSSDGVSVDEGLICTTNHQRTVVDPKVEHDTMERYDYLVRKAGKLSPSDFFDSPLYNSHFSDGYGTLYTVELDPRTGEANYYWPQGKHLTVSEKSEEQQFVIQWKSER
jgi:Predicted choloylglycine hydrolase